jgi:hypothetical protein
MQVLRPHNLIQPNVSISHLRQRSVEENELRYGAADESNKKHVGLVVGLPDCTIAYSETHQVNHRFGNYIRVAPEDARRDCEGSNHRHFDPRAKHVHFES